MPSKLTDKVLLEIGKLRGRKRPASSTTLVRRELPLKIPLSFAQERLWFVEQVAPGSYLVQAAMRITGPLRLDLWERALESVVARHDALRATFHTDEEGRAYQELHDDVAGRLSVQACRASETLEDATFRIAAVEQAAGVALSNGPVLRCAIVVRGPLEHAALFTLHHLVSDGWSVAIFVHDLSEFYRAAEEGREPRLTHLPLRFVDYALWERERVQGPELERLRNYWKKQLTGAPPVLELPTDRPRDAPRTHATRRITLPIPSAVDLRLVDLGRSRGASPFMTYLAVCALLLGRTARAEDMIIGTQVALRDQPDLQGIVGILLNGLALRIAAPPSSTFRELLERVKVVCLGAYEHQTYPFERVVADLDVPRSAKRHPVFQVHFAVDNFPGAKESSGGLQMRQIELEATASELDLSLRLTTSASDVRCIVAEYSRDLFDDSTIEEMLSRFLRLAELIGEGATQTASLEQLFIRASTEEQRETLALLQESERQQMRNAAELAFWRDELRGAPLELNLPKDDLRRNRTASMNARSTVSRALELPGVEPLRDIEEREGVTTSVVLLAAYFAFLSKIAGARDIVIGFGERSATETFPLRAAWPRNATFRDVVREVKSRMQRARAHAPFTSVEAIDSGASLVPSSVSQVLFVLDESPRVLGDSRAQGIAHASATFEISLSITHSEGRQEASFDYDTTLFEKSTVERFALHFTRLLGSAISRPDEPAERLPVLDGNEERALIDLGNGGAPEIGPSVLHEQFRLQAERTPRATAIVFRDGSLTYAELEEASNRLASALRTAGVRTGHIVPILFDRSADTVTAILAVLKAGAAYVPLERAIPNARARAILDKVGARVAVSWRSLAGHEWLAGLVTLFVDDEARKGSDEDAHRLWSLPRALDPRSPAYLIFTSGSTGEPKGVLLAHRAVADVARAHELATAMGPSDRVLQFASYTFDASVAETFTALLCGATLVICPEAERADPLSFCERESITIATFPPAVLAAGPLPPSLRSIVSAGEAASAHVLSHAKTRRLVNAYGPTEGTVCATMLVMTPDGDSRSIGKPIPGVQTYVVDERLALTAPGVAGELCIAGDNLAHGYLGRGDLTAERFVPDPYSAAPGTRMYRTGDLVRQRRDGVDFLGRIDFQIKLRGFRVELGEIESVIASIAGIRGCAVVLRETSSEKRLVAYVQGTVSEDAIERHVRSELPEYMVPTAFVFLDALPLNASGKVDRKALPAPDASSAFANFAAPRTAVEAAIAQAFAQTLGLERVGIRDDFFALGGDSIRAMQVVAKIRSAGFSTRVAELFENSTVTALAAAVTPLVEGRPTAAFVPGPAPLGAIQSWFFEHHGALAHFNQSLLLALHITPSASIEKVSEALAIVASHHDALRHRFLLTAEGTWSQEALADAPAPPVDFVDLSSVPPASVGSALERVCSNLQSNLDLTRGPLFRGAYVRLAEGRSRLFLVAHHLVIDGVSWRILVDDLTLLLSSPRPSASIALPKKTSSFRSWLLRMSELAVSDAYEAHARHWLALPWTSLAPLRTDRTPKRDATRRETDTRSTTLDRETTLMALGAALVPLKLHIDELLLAALGCAVHEDDDKAFALTLEGHGRDEEASALDVSRTVGWFTSAFPVLLSWKANDTTTQILLSVKESLRALPLRGIPFGVVAAHGRAETAHALRALPTPSISFNYLGQTSAGGDLRGELPALALATESTGSDVAADARAVPLLDFNLVEAEGQLVVHCTYRTDAFDEGSIEKLLARFASELERLTVAAAVATPTLSPADFPLVKLSRHDLDVVFANVDEGDIDDILPLSPLQAGLLVQSLRANDDTYLVHARYEFDTSLDHGAFQQAYRIVTQRFDALRTLILWDGLHEPLQVVRKIGASHFDVRDVGHLAAEQQLAYIDDAYESLMRLRIPSEPHLVLVLGSDAYTLLSCQHHSTTDGWSNGLVLAEVAKAYADLTNGRIPSETKGPRFRNYIAWLAARSTESERSFWKNYLRDAQPTRLLGLLPPGSDAPRRSHSVTITLTKNDTEALTRQAATLHVTASTLVLAAWALTIAVHSEESDLLLGMTVSGRDNGIDNAFALVGPLLNSITVRVALENVPASDWVRKLQRNLLELQPFHHSPLTLAQQASAIPQALFDTLFVFENYPVDQEALASSGLPLRELRAEDPTHYLLNASSTLTDVLRVTLRFDLARVPSSLAEQFASTLERTLVRFAIGPLEKPATSWPWLQALEERTRRAADLTFWKSELEDVDLVLGFPADALADATAIPTVSQTTSRIAPSNTLRLRAFAEREGSSLAKVLFAAYAIFIAKHTQRRDLVIGLDASFDGGDPSDERPDSGPHHFPVRVRQATGASFSKILEAVTRQARRASEHGEVALSQILAVVPGALRDGRTSLFQTAFTFEAESPNERTNAVDQRHLEGLELALTCTPSQDGSLDLTFHRTTSLFSEATARTWHDRFAGLLSQLDTRATAFELATKSERTFVTENWNATAAPYDIYEPVHQLIAKRAALMPSAVALISEEATLTYREVDARASRLARLLVRKGIAQNSVVALNMNRSFELVISMLAVLKAGCAYLPLDPENPKARLQYCLRDSNAAALLVDEANRDSFPSEDIFVAVIDAAVSVAREESDAEFALPSHLLQVMYVLYTSGSTGKPKGVAVQHLGVLNHVLWRQTIVNVGPSTTILQRTSHSFDGSVWWFFGPLCFGGRIVLASPGKHWDSGYLCTLIERWSCEAVEASPSFLRAMVDVGGIERCKSIRWFFIGGEAMTQDLVAAYRARGGEAELHDGYGPTEATIMVLDTAYRHGEPRRPIRFGAPFRNTRIYLADDEMCLTPLGSIGEMMIGGDCLARGYHEHPELTAERFVPDPFSGEAGARVYLTGDLGRLRANGELEFIGRKDNQVKIRGFRVELLEIEARLLNLDGVKEAAVVLHLDPARGNELVTYLVLKPDANVASLRDALSKDLPHYMVPAHWQVLEEMPINGSGKLDRARLPALETSSIEEEYVEPATLEEEVIAKIFASLTGRPRVSATDDFFALGGHSLTAMRVVARIRDELDVEVPLRTLFSSSSPRALGTAIEELMMAAVLEDEETTAGASSEGPAKDDQE